MPGYVVIENIRRVIHHFGHISQFKAYLEIKNETIPWHKSLRSELQSSGVSLTDCPHNGRKDAVDKMIMVDMLGFAIDQAPPATIVLISGDKDFVYALSTLRNRRYTVVLIVPNKGAPIILKSQASVILEWRYDVLNQNIWALQQQQVMQSSSSGASNSGSIRPSPVSSTYSDMESSPDAPSFKMTSEAGGSPLKSEITTIEELSSSHSEVSNDDKNANESDGLSIKTKKPSIIGSDDEYIGFCFSPKAPGYFDLLAEVLEKFRMAGETRPRRSKVGHELINKNPLLYHRASCANFKGNLILSIYIYIY